MKVFSFSLIVIVVLGITGYLIYSTISQNLVSVTKGPVHWHADFEIYNCGEKLDLADPEGFENKIGTPLFHEHNDNRIHVEGPVLDYKDITLGSFFETIGGKLTDTSIEVPTNVGVVKLENGDMCRGSSAKFQVFVYRTQGVNFYQEKLQNSTEYVVSSHSQVPPGDCIIIEIDKPKEKTDKLCNFYKVAIEKGELHER